MLVATVGGRKEFTNQKKTGNEKLFYFYSGGLRVIRGVEHGFYGSELAVPHPNRLRRLRKIRYVHYVK